ncbi:MULTISPECIES: hypothetical protein, partial [unclassified Pseudomonas]|uniref:hypothetical protein n=1 Tax=unclassified Pseudomonas TaxID=196821 RepID=UPI001A9184DA
CEAASYSILGIRWEVSPGHTCGARESQVNKIMLPLLATGDRQARKPAQNGIPHTAVELTRTGKHTAAPMHLCTEQSKR